MLLLNLRPHAFASNLFACSFLTLSHLCPQICWGFPPVFSRPTACSNTPRGSVGQCRLAIVCLLQKCCGGGLVSAARQLASFMRASYAALIRCRPLPQSRASQGALRLRRAVQWQVSTAAAHRLLLPPWPRGPCSSRLQPGSQALVCVHKPPHGSRLQHKECSSRSMCHHCDCHGNILQSGRCIRFASVHNKLAGSRT